MKKKRNRHVLIPKMLAKEIYSRDFGPILSQKVACLCLTAKVSHDKKYRLVLEEIK